MIKANELRTGNLVTDEFYGSFKTIIKVDSINDKGINLAIEDDGNYPECANRWIEPYYKFNELCGIPLTEEILLKCGFKIREITVLGATQKHFSDFKNIAIEMLNSDYFMLGQHKGYEHVEPIRRVETLHQLQNLYFELTGEELQITFL